MVKFKWKISIAYSMLLLVTIGLLALFLNKAIPNIPWAMFWQMVITLVTISSVFFFLWVRQLTSSLEELAELTQAFVAGDYDHKMLLPVDDEIGVIANNIQIMVTKWRQSLRENQKETSRVSTILASMVEGVIAFDQVGKIILLNNAAEKMFNITCDDAYKRYFLEVVRNSQLSDVLKATLGSGKHHVVEINYQDQIYRIYVAPILVAKKDMVQGAVMVLRNITEVRRLEQVRTDFVANVSHELRTPLTSIKGYLETLLDGAVEEVNIARQFLRTMENETIRLQRLIEDLLTLSKVETGKFEVVKKPIDLRYLLNHVIEILAPFLKERCSSLYIDIEDTLTSIMGHEDMLEQVFINLFDNAIKYSPDKSVITFKAYREEDGVILQVIDQGVGIPSDSLSRIFERFYRVDKARSRQVGGTGLGLSIVKHIVERHRGRIQVESQVGEGTAITVFLPLA